MPSPWYSTKRIVLYEINGFYMHVPINYDSFCETLWMCININQLTWLCKLCSCNLWSIKLQIVSFSLSLCICFKIECNDGMSWSTLSSQQIDSSHQLKTNGKAIFSHENGALLEYFCTLQLPCAASKLMLVVSFVLSFGFRLMCNNMDTEEWAKV